jgi:hypothetical protein
MWPEASAGKGATFRKQNREYSDYLKSGPGILIIGYATKCGNKVRVNPADLTPRPFLFCGRTDHARGLNTQGLKGGTGVESRNKILFVRYKRHTDRPMES